MNYRHIYHAGVFADVFKHVILISLLNYLKNKPGAFCYLDTHAGIGCYPLESDESKKTLEYTTGIGKIYSEKNAPPLVQTYLDIIHQVNEHSDGLVYPGSPLIAEHVLREQDRMILCELHPDDYKTLKQRFYHNKHIATHLQNGYLALKAFLPPKEKRGLVFIDPSYEIGNDFTQIITALNIALKSWPNGMYAIWYPIKANLALQPFFRDMLNIVQSQSILKAELNIYPANSPQTLNGSGMLIINPPWQLDQLLKEPLAWLWRKLAVSQDSTFSVEFLERIKPR